MSIHAIHRDPPPWTFGDRLRKVRRSLPGHVTQEQFAEQLGYPPKRYEQWEADRNLPGSQTVEVARRIQQVTGVPAAWMLDINGPAPDGTTVTRQKHQGGSHLQLVAAA